MSPEPYVYGSATLFVRNFTVAERDEFIKQLAAETRSKYWVIAHGLCDAQGNLVIEDPAAADEKLKDMVVEHIEALEAVVFRKMGMRIDSEKKD